MSLLADENNNSHRAKNIYHQRDLFQRQDKWFPSLTRLKTGVRSRHTDVKESAEDARGHAQEGVPGHYRRQGGSGMGEVPWRQVPNRQLYFRGSDQVQDGEG